MQTHAIKSQSSDSKAVANRSAAYKHAGDAAVMVADSSPESMQLMTLQMMADNSPQALDGARLQAMADGGPSSVAQMMGLEGMHGGPVQHQNEQEKQAIQRSPGADSIQLQGQEEEDKSKEGTSTYAEVSEWIHIGLDGAGLTPALGVFPDAANAVFYMIEGDWVNAGISTLAMAPVFGQAAIATKYGVKISKRTAQRLGKEGIERGVKKAIRKNAAKKGTKDAAKKGSKRRISECKSIHGAYDAFEPCHACEKGESKAQRVAKVTCLTAVIAGRDKFLKKKCDYVLRGSKIRGSLNAEKGHKNEVSKRIKTLKDCSTMPSV